MDKKLVQGEREYGFAAVEHMSRGAKRKVYGALNRRSDRGGGRGGRGGGRGRGRGNDSFRSQDRFTNRRNSEKPYGKNS